MHIIITFDVCHLIAAEIAAKKTRVKQSLIKRARSVAIFSLKLKERRAREAEKQAANAAEHAMVIYNGNLYLHLNTFNLLFRTVLVVFGTQAINPAPPGGELDMIGIEQLIQIDDVIQHKT